MANRRDYFFRQKVTEAELDAGFEGLELADRNLAVDHDLTGVVQGMGVSEKSGTPDLTVDVQGPGVAYSKQGERIAFASLQNVDVSVDDAAASTAVGSPGNEKWISLFVEFDRNLSDPRIDGLAATVFFVRDETFAFSVVQGAEALIGAATRPAIDSGKILLADIRRTNGVTQILNAEIYTNRREDAYRLTGTVPLVAGSAREAIEDLLTALNQHLDGTANQHPAAELTYGGSGNWATGTGLAAGTVEAALDQVVSDLATVAATSGADRVGIRASVNTWADATGFLASNVWSILNGILNTLGSGTAANSGARKVGIEARTNWLGGRTNPATAVFQAIDKIITDLATTTASDDGAERIGAQASGNLAAGSVRSQLDELDSEKLARAGGTMTGDITFDADSIVWTNYRDATALAGGDPGIRTESLNSIRAWGVIRVNSGPTSISNLFTYGISATAFQGSGIRVTMHRTFSSANGVCPVVNASINGYTVTIANKSTTYFDFQVTDETGALVDLSTWAAGTISFHMIVVGDIA